MKKIPVLIFPIYGIPGVEQNAQIKRRLTQPFTSEWDNCNQRLPYICFNVGQGDGYRQFYPTQHSLKLLYALLTGILGDGGGGLGYGGQNLCRE